ncbi:hypothetical protein V1514DRAFT_299739 [Lipomyces japonicus]|uniref:uncharacterized protein n=1 Tax=Lipomyces japonicus TaxID=56871 RepID=UPI0034CD1AD9
MTLISAREEDKSQLLLDLLKNSFASAKFTGKAVWIGLLTSLGSAIIVFVAFCILRPRNSIIYAPKTRLNAAYDSISINTSTTSRTAAMLPRLNQNVVTWIFQVWNLNVLDLVDILGLDSVVYLRFMKMCTHMFIYLSLLGLAIAIPINVTFSLRNPLASNLSTSDAFILMTPTLLSGRPMIAHVVLAYVVDFTVFFCLWKMYRDVFKLKQEYFVSKEYKNSLHSRSLLIFEITKRFRSNAGLATILADAKESRKVEQVVIGRSSHGLGTWVAEREECVLELESILAKYLKYPDNLPSTRPICKPMKNDSIHDRHKKLDAIDYYLNRIQTLEDKILIARQSLGSRKEMPYGFASYPTVADAHAVAIANRSSSLTGNCRIKLAPTRTDIIWDNIVLTKEERLRKKHMGNLIFFFVCVVWIVPNAFIGTFLTQISRIGILWSDFGVYMSRHPTAFSFIQGFIAPMVTSLVFLILPIIMRRMTSWQGTLTKSTRERNTFHKLYIFFVFNNLIIFTCFGVAWSVITQIIQISRSNKNLSASQVFKELDIAKQLSNAVIGITSFWVMYIVRVNFGSALDLIQVWNLLVRSFATHFMSPTPRQMIKWTAPPEFHYASYYNWTLFYVTIALAFTTIQPLILIVTAFYFFVDSFLKKYSLIYVFATRVESNGSYWHDLFDRILFAVFFGNLVMFLISWVQGSWVIAMGLVPLFFAVVGFKLYCRATFDLAINYVTSVNNTVIDDSVPEYDIDAASVYESNDLRVEYGNPEIYRKLIVPMVKESAESVLPRIYSGNQHSRTAGVDSAFEVIKEDEMDIIKFTADENYAPETNEVQLAKAEQQVDYSDDQFRPEEFQYAETTTDPNRNSWIKNGPGNESLSVEFEEDPYRSDNDFVDDEMIQASFNTTANVESQRGRESFRRVKSLQDDEFRLL